MRAAAAAACVVAGDGASTTTILYFLTFCVLHALTNTSSIYSRHINIVLPRRHWPINARARTAWTSWAIHIMPGARETPDDSDNDRRRRSRPPYIRIVLFILLDKNVTLSARSVRPLQRQQQQQQLSSSCLTIYIRSVSDSEFIAAVSPVVRSEAECGRRTRFQSRTVLTKCVRWTRARMNAAPQTTLDCERLFWNIV